MCRQTMGQILGHEVNTLMQVFSQAPWLVVTSRI